MKDILNFMGEHPFLTFFLIAIFLQAIVYGVRYIAVIFQGWPPPDSPEAKEDDDDED